MNNNYKSGKKSILYGMEIRVISYTTNQSNTPILDNISFIEPLMKFLLSKAKFSNIQYHPHQEHSIEDIVQNCNIIETSKIHSYTEVKISINKAFKEYIINDSLSENGSFKIFVMDLYATKNRETSIATFTHNCENIYIYNATSEEKDYILSLFQGKDFRVYVFEEEE